jgi:hypothetical protein
VVTHTPQVVEVGVSEQDHVISAGA